MQGIMFTELSRYVDVELGRGSWLQVLDEAGLADRTYSPRSPSPDPEFVRLVAAAAKLADRSDQTLLEGFGVYVSADLLGGLYGLLVDPTWELMDFLEHTEASIHTVVRTRDPSATPPQLRIDRPDANEVRIVYDSTRRMCSLAKGIIHGASDHYGEPVEILESDCMLKGADRCEIVVRKLPSSLSPSPDPPR